MQTDGTWTRKDFWTGLLLFAFGGLVVTYASLAMRRGTPALFWSAGWVVGPLLVLLGGHAMVRSLLARGSTDA